MEISELVQPTQNQDLRNVTFQRVASIEPFLPLCDRVFFITVKSKTLQGRVLEEDYIHSFFFLPKEFNSPPGSWVNIQGNHLIRSPKEEGIGQEYGMPEGSKRKANFKGLSWGCLRYTVCVCALACVCVYVPLCACVHTCMLVFVNPTTLGYPGQYNHICTNYS